MSFCTWNNGFAYEYEGTYQNKKNAITEAKKIRRQGKIKKEIKQEEETITNITRKKPRVEQQ